jgi:hypothetical protein
MALLLNRYLILLTFIASCFHLASFGFSCPPPQQLSDELKDTPVTRSKSVTDSLSVEQDSSNVYYFYSDFERAGNPRIFSSDTALENFQNYDPLYKNHRFFATLGNIGQNYRNLIPFNTIEKPLGLDYGIHSFDNYLLSSDSVRYYKIYRTFSELTYSQGAKKEQNFKVEFSRDIYRGLNLGFNFRVASAPGAYTRQKTNHINLIINGQFFTLNKRYGVIANFVFNRLKNYENGGLKSDSLFINNIEPNRIVIPVNLSAAENRVRESGFFMKHYFDLTRKSSPFSDSLSVEKNRADLGRLTYSFSFNRQIQNFLDIAADSAFFPPPLIDSVNTVDSITIRKFENIFTWSNPTHKRDLSPRIIQLEAGIRQSYSEISVHDVKNSFIQYIPFSTLTLTPLSSLQLTVHGEYTIGDYNEQDFLLNACLNSVLGKKNKNIGSVVIKATVRSEQPGWFYSNYKGNFYQWAHSWKKTNIIRTEFTYRLKFLETGVSLNRITNYVYLDSTSKPAQLPDEFAYLQVFLKTRMELWKFRIHSHLIYHTIQKTNVLRLPAFMGNVSLYYYQPLFHGAAILEPGLNLFYNTSYYADNYNPSLRSFYLQNTKEVGNYITMDIFVGLKIQRARFFITYTHFNAGMMGYNYFSTPDYPLQDGAFKFGISWRFHD